MGMRFQQVVPGHLGGRFPPSIGIFEDPSKSNSRWLLVPNNRTVDIHADSSVVEVYADIPYGVSHVSDVPPTDMKEIIAIALCVSVQFRNTNEKLK